MLYFNIMPVFIEVFSDKTAMTVVRLFLAAEQTPAVQYLAGCFQYGAPAPDEIEKLPRYHESIR